MRQITSAALTFLTCLGTSLTAAPIPAENQKGDPDGMVRCADGEFAELYLDRAGWHWVNEGFPLVRGVPTRVTSDPSFAAPASFIAPAPKACAGSLATARD